LPKRISAKVGKRHNVLIGKEMKKTPTVPSAGERKGGVDYTDVGNPRKEKGLLVRLRVRAWGLWRINRLKKKRTRRVGPQEVNRKDYWGIATGDQRRRLSFQKKDPTKKGGKSHRGGEGHV